MISDPGRLALHEVKAGECLEDLSAENVGACFSLKSPNTLLKRFLAMKSHSDWLRSDGAALWLPFDEALIWFYFKRLRSSKSAAVKAVFFIDEAVRFTHFILSQSGQRAICSRQVGPQFCILLISFLMPSENSRQF